MEKDPSNLASLKLIMSQQNYVAAQKASAVLGPINRFLLSRFNVDSRFGILRSMTAFSKVSSGIFHVTWEFGGHIYLGITLYWVPLLEMHSAY